MVYKEIMTQEQSMWATLRRIMGKRWHATRHEDRIARGIPDLSFGILNVQGWIELKCMPSWPKENGILRIPHYTPDQRLWMYLRGKGCWLLLKVEKDWLIFNHIEAQEVGKLTKEQLFKCCVWKWEGTLPNAAELTHILTRL